MFRQIAGGIFSPHPPRANLRLFPGSGRAPIFPDQRRAIVTDRAAIPFLALPVNLRLLHVGVPAGLQYILGPTL